MNQVASTPYLFPLEGRFEPRATALLVVDMQVDFCAEGGLMHALGCELKALRAPIDPIRRVLGAARGKGLTVVHTREAFSPDLSNLQPHRRWRGRNGGPAVGDRGPRGRYLVRGEPCWEIIPELAPRPGEAIFDKPGYGAFGTTAIDRHLRERGIRHLVLTGITTDCCIQSNLREALDRGYDCLTLADCCGAVTTEIHELSLRLIGKPSGIFGALARAEDFLTALAASEAAALA